MKRQKMPLPPKHVPFENAVDVPTPLNPLGEGAVVGAINLTFQLCLAYENEPQLATTASRMTVFDGFGWETEAVWQLVTILRKEFRRPRADLIGALETVLAKVKEIGKIDRGAAL